MIRNAIRDAIRFESYNIVFFSQDPIGSLRDSIRDAMRNAMRDADAIFASLIASLKLRDAKFLADRIPRANFRDATEGCGPIASLIMHSLHPCGFVRAAPHGFIKETGRTPHGSVRRRTDPDGAGRLIIRFVAPPLESCSSSLGRNLILYLAR